jgi:hypothetical protein
MSRRRFEASPIFSLGPSENGLRPLRMRSALIEDHNMTVEEVRTCMAHDLCGPNLRAFLPWTGIPSQQIGVLP